MDESSFWQRINPPRRARRWAYGIAAAVIALLTTYEVIEVDQAAAWGYLASALFSIAAANTGPLPPAPETVEVEDLEDTEDEPAGDLDPVEDETTGLD